MDWDHLHLIRGDSVNVVYHYPTSNLILVNNQTYEAMDAIRAGMSIEEATRQYGDCLLPFSQLMRSISSDKQVIGEEFTENKRVLNRITLHISNDCNLRCRYCYADGGNYKQERSLMTEQTAKEFVDFCVGNFDQINQIAFFGGEPMLNLKIMNYICGQFKQRYIEGRSAFIPQFGIITNGTILAPKIIQFIKDNISCITVSIDGPENVNDANRIDKDGKGSYEKIKRFIYTIRKETNALIQYEATYTQEHIDAGYTYGHISEFMFNEFGIKGTVVSEYSLNADNMLDTRKK